MKYTAQNEHPEYGYGDWQYAYHEGHTRKGYHDYVTERIAGEADRELARMEAKYNREAREQEIGSI